MNSVFNGKIAELTPFTESFVSSCPDDSGTAVGAAMYLEALRTGRQARRRPPAQLLGSRVHATTSASAARRATGCPTSRSSTTRAAAAAADLVDGRILGWFQGAMEFGQRALGNRSILLDPRRPDGKDVVNAAVKFRESFRPFAPAILAERVGEWFDCPDGTQVPYMERVFPFRPGEGARRCRRWCTSTAPAGSRPSTAEHAPAVTAR